MEALLRPQLGPHLVRVRVGVRVRVRVEVGVGLGLGGEPHGGGGQVDKAECARAAQMLEVL